MNFFSNDHPNSALHDLISGQADPETVERTNKRRSTDPLFDAEAIEFERIRRGMKSLPNIPVPRSFRLNPQMVGVKPPKPRAFAWLSYAASTAGLICVLSIGARVVNTPLGTALTDLAKGSAPAMLEAPIDAPMMAPAEEAPMDAPEAAAFAEMQAEEPAPEDLALQSAPMEAPSDVSARKLPEEMSEVGSVVTENTPTRSLFAIPTSELIMWISLGFTMTLFVGLYIARIFQLRAWRMKWKQ